jgi:hypothetical protein
MIDREGRRQSLENQIKLNHFKFQISNFKFEILLLSKTKKRGQLRPTSLNVQRGIRTLHLFHKRYYQNKLTHAKTATTANN